MNNNFIISNKNEQNEWVPPKPSKELFEWCEKYFDVWAGCSNTINSSGNVLNCSFGSIDGKCANKIVWWYPNFGDGIANRCDRHAIYKKTIKELWHQIYYQAILRSLVEVKLLPEQFEEDLPFFHRNI